MEETLGRTSLRALFGFTFIVGLMVNGVFHLPRCGFSVRLFG